MRYHRPKKSQPQSLPMWLMLIVALIAGLLFVFALAPYQIWGVAILSPMLLYALLLGKTTPKQGLLLGWAYGFGLWATGAFWLFNSIHTYGNISTPLALLLIALMALIMGLFHAVMAWLFVGVLGRQPLAFAAIWVFQEWLKTWLLTGFPWLFVGYAYTDLPFVVALAPFVGVFGLSFLSVLLSASLVEAYRHKVGYLLIASTGLIVAFGVYLAKPVLTTPTGERLTVSLLQGNIDQAVKWDDNYQQAILQTYANLLAGEWGRDMLVLPEAAIPMFQDEATAFLDVVRAKAAASGSVVVTGIPYKDFSEQQDGQFAPFYNALLVVDGKQDNVYKKQRLVPFGEYIPLQGLLNILPNLGNHQVIGNSQGSANQPPLLVHNTQVGAAICYEVAYPKTTRLNAKNSDFLLTVSNDAWFGTSAGPHQHLQMVRMRSLENGKWFVRATNNGISALIDDKGQLVQTIPQFRQGVLQGEVILMSGTTPYGRFGDYPILALIAVLLALSFWAKRLSLYDKDGKYLQSVH